MKTLPRKPSFLFLFFLLLIFVFSGCKQRGTHSSADSLQKEIQVKESIQKQVEEFIYPLPTTYEVVQMLQDIGIPYIIGISNPTEEASHYLTAKSQAYNIGVYSADLSYASVYNMQQDVMLYLETVKKLGDDLGLTAVYNEDLFNAIEQNLNNKDTLVNLLSGALFDSYNQLNQNGKGSLSHLMVAGGWIEALFITTHVSATAYNNYELVKIIFEQKSSLNKLLDIINEKRQNKDIAELIAWLQPLKKVYDTINGSMTEDQINQVATIVEELRNKLVQ
ncbi:MAG: hypothetical protein GXO83_13560 [Chlorobi bacterium]|nr:hypothetical protein [Chlorobiota bacterium]